MVILRADCSANIGWAVEPRKYQPLTEKNLLDIHGEVMADIDTTNEGVFRADRVLIRRMRFVPPGSHRFGELIPRLFEFANESGIHPVIRPLFVNNSDPVA